MIIITVSWFINIILILFPITAMDKLISELEKNIYDRFDNCVFCNKPGYYPYLLHGTSYMMASCNEDQCIEKAWNHYHNYAHGNYKPEETAKTFDEFKKIIAIQRIKNAKTHLEIIFDRMTDKLNQDEKKIH